MTLRTGSALRLPRADGSLVAYTAGQAAAHPQPVTPIRSRTAFAAVHVVADPFANSLDAPAVIDWDATLSYRRHIWSYGLGVAEAMDTAQRGMGLGWPAARQLVKHSAAEARTVGGRIACGAGTDQLAASGTATLDEIGNAYEEQCGVVEDAGAQIVLMASRHLAAAAQNADDYATVYGRILAQVREPVILHWLGPMFDSRLAGYWGHEDLDAAVDVCLALIADHETRIDGIKLSLLDRDREVAFRSRLPAGVRLYTGDDFNYPELIAGDGTHHSDALLGIFDVIAPAASAALQALDRDDLDGYHRILESTLPLARHVFASPTYCYKTGVVFAAYLNGWQSHFRMVDGLESGRSVTHLAELFVHLDRAGLITDPDAAAERMRRYLALAGVE